MTCQANAGSSLSSMPRFCLRGKSLFPFSSRLQVFVVRYMLCFLSLFGLSGCGDSSIKPPSSNFQSLASSSDNLGAGLTVKSVKGIRSRVIVKFRVRPEAVDSELSRAAWVSRRLGRKLAMVERLVCLPSLCTPMRLPLTV